MAYSALCLHVCSNPNVKIPKLPLLFGGKTNNQLVCTIKVFLNSKLFLIIIMT